MIGLLLRFGTLALFVAAAFAATPALAADQYSWHAACNIVSSQPGGSISTQDCKGGPFTTQQACWADYAQHNTPPSTVDDRQTHCTCGLTIAQQQTTDCPGYFGPTVQSTNTNTGVQLTNTNTNSGLQNTNNNTQTQNTNNNNGTQNTNNNTGTGLLNPLSAGTSLEQFLHDILALVIRIGTIVIVLMLVYIGFLFATSSINPENKTNARTYLLWTVVGALILLGAQAIASGIQATVNALSAGS